MKPSVDVVVPCYNYGRYLDGCVRSILDQPAVTVRVLIIDDCSTDDTIDVGLRLAAGDRRVTYRRHEVNHGHIATYNEGLLEWASADYSLLISADDMLTPGALVRAALALDSLPGAGLCYGSQVVFKDKIPDVPRVIGDPQVRVMSGAEFWAQSCRTGQNAVATPTAVVRTSVQREVGPYRPELPHSGDFEMWLRIAARTDIASIEAPQAFKRMHGENMQVRHFSRAIDDLRQRQLALESALAACRTRLTDPHGLKQTFRRTLSLEAFWRASVEFDEGRVAFEQWLRTACELDPTIVSTAEWRRMSIKQRMGTGLWRVVQRLVDTLRA